MTTDPRQSSINFQTEDEERIATDKDAARVARVFSASDMPEHGWSGLFVLALCRRIVELKAEVERLRAKPDMPDVMRYE